MRIALVTCRELPEPDPDESLLLEALSNAGMSPSMLAWDDPDGDPAAFDVCVIRSTWNYYRDPQRFREWIDRAERASVLMNPAPVLRWNLHKGYLRELESRGVPIVPTAWVDRGESADLAALLDERGWRDVVVKPAISAASYRTQRFARDDAGAAQRFLGEITADRDAMIQPFLRSVETEGERVVMRIGEEITHAVRKKPRFHGADEAVSEALPVLDDERELAAAALAGVPGDLLYARVDVMRDDAGRALLSELELLEPSLYLLQSPRALGLFIEAIRALEPRVRERVGK